MNAISWLFKQKLIKQTICRFGAFNEDIQIIVVIATAQLTTPLILSFKHFIFVKHSKALRVDNSAFVTLTSYEFSECGPNFHAHFNIFCCDWRGHYSFFRSPNTTLLRKFWIIFIFFSRISLLWIEKCANSCFLIILKVRTTSIRCMSFVRTDDTSWYIKRGMLTSKCLSRIIKRLRLRQLFLLCIMITFTCWWNCSLRSRLITRNCCSQARRQVWSDQPNYFEFSNCGLIACFRLVILASHKVLGVHWCHIRA